jgi:diguanylate cyclase (GGDEF)-like protein/PAS domain S-box-containing protein
MDDQRFRLVFASDAVGTSIARLKPGGLGPFEWVNKSFCELTGYDEQDLYTLTGRHLTYSLDLAAHDAVMSDLVEGVRTTVRREQRYVRADGELVWVRVTDTAISAGEQRLLLSHCEDITEQRQVEEALAHRAFHDPLTGLANRQLFMDHLRLAVHSLGRTGGEVAVLFVDVDRFKSINDRWGHRAGDDALRQIAQRLQASVRIPDTAARLGGDEFALVCPVADHTGAARIAERLHLALNEPLNLEGRLVSVGTSMGVAATDSATTDPGELLARADQAMYRAKRGGGQSWFALDGPGENSEAGWPGFDEGVGDGVDLRLVRWRDDPMFDLIDGRPSGRDPSGLASASGP